MTRLKLCIHPVYFGVMLYYIVVGKAIVFISFFVAVLLHELAHAYVAHAQGYAMERITLMPYGALLGGGADMPPRVMLKVAIAGPIANLVLAALTLSLWWIMPSLYEYTRYFLYACVTIAVFNILPAYPLDGGRCILCIRAKNKLRLVLMLRISGVIIGITFIVLAVISAFFSFNVSLVFTGVFLVLSATLGGGEAAYSHIASRSLAHKQYGDGVIVSEVVLSSDCTLIRLLRLIKPTTLVTVHVVCQSGEVVAIINEEDIARLVTEYSLHTQLSVALRLT